MGSAALEIAVAEAEALVDLGALDLEVFVLGALDLAFLDFLGLLDLSVAFLGAFPLGAAGAAVGLGLAAALFLGLAALPFGLAALLFGFLGLAGARR